MIKKTSKNDNFQYENIADNSKGTVNLFNCPLCGYHTSTIVKYWVKGFEEQYSLEMLSIHPERETKSFSITDPKPIAGDGEMAEEYMCGKCGGPGGMEDVTVELLEMYGYDPLHTSSECQSSENFLLKGIKRIFNSIRSFF